MKTFRLALVPLVLACLSGLAGAETMKTPRAASRPQTAASAASVASAPAEAPVRHATPGNRQHQLLGRCTEKVNASGATGTARKRAMADCLRAS